MFQVNLQMICLSFRLITGRLADAGVVGRAGVLFGAEQGDAARANQFEYAEGTDEVDE